MNERIWATIIMLLMITSSLIVQIPSGGADREEDPSFKEYEGPYLWTHLGPARIQDLYALLSADPHERTVYHIVQFDSPILEEDERNLLSLGVTILDYFPDNAIIVRLNGADIEDLDRVPGTIATAPFFRELKIHPDFLSSYENGGDPFSEFNSMTIETFTGESIETELFLSGHVFERTTNTRYVVDLPVDLYRLMSIDGIKWIEPRSIMEIHNNVAEGIIDVDLVWDDLGLDGSGQMVGISDTGLDTGVDNHGTNGDIHADIDNRATIRDWTGAGSLPDDGHGHGTHVTGSVAGNGARSGGSIKGMAYNASVFFQALETDTGFLNSPSNLSQLFTQAYNGGARIHTNSWGSSSPALWGAYTSESYDVDWSQFYYPDLLILFSAGNDGNDGNSNGKVDPNSVSPPSTMKSGITVGASENLRSSGGYQGSWGSGWPMDFPANPINSDRPSNNSNGLAAFSSRGPLDDGRLKPDIVAPGTNILSMRSSLSSSQGWGPFNSSYVYYGGTSMSSPITAGMAALVREFYNVTLDMGSPSAALLKATILNGADDMAPGQYGAASATTKEIESRPDMDQGWGRINLKNSIDPDGKSLAFLDNSSGMGTGKNITRMFRVSSSDQELRLTLAWSDYPGSLFAGKQLINDLDLILEAPDGTIYNGNDLTAPFDDSRDSINPVEGITIVNPQTGWWKVIVEGNNVPRGPQHFALVGTGNMTSFITNEMIMSKLYYSTDNDTITLSLTSREMAGMGNIIATINSTSDPAGKGLLMVEEGNFGTFMGSIRTSNVSTPDPGMLFVSHDDDILASYSSPLDINFTADAMAKRPARVDQVRLKENLLVYSRYDDLKLRGVGDPSLEVHWTVPGSNLPWVGLHDDGLAIHNDPVAGDGDYNTNFYLSEPYHANGTITIRVDDPFLGPLYYDGFHIAINSSRPGAPSDLEAVPIDIGNTVLLKWNRSRSLGVYYHEVYVNRTSDPSLDMSDWTLYSTTEDPNNLTIVNRLTDGIEYHFRVAAADINGNASTPSFPVSAIPYDGRAPFVEYTGVPEVLSGVENIHFEADDDLDLLELEYYIDENGDGIVNDNGTFEIAAGSSSKVIVWDTRNTSGGPGNVERMILRFRGSDEVPNTSNWTYISGFGVDNTGPLFLELVTYPPRITNGTDFDLTGTTEPMAKVIAELNGIVLGEFIAGVTGLFDLSIELVEGLNHLNLSAYDLYGAGPITANYTFTRDTMDPVALIRGFDPLLEIQCNCTPMISDSYDQGFDPDLSRIENHTWTLTGPFGATYRSYGRIFERIYAQTGEYRLELVVRDGAMNRDKTSVSFTVVDRTPPDAVIDGPLTGNEDTTYTFTIEGSTDNDPSFPGRNSVSISWEFSGPDNFTVRSERTDPSVLFPEPGTYSIALKIEDSGGNIGTAFRTIDIMDITPPTVDLVGDNIFDLNELATFSVDMEDNHPDHMNGSAYLWILIFNDENGTLVATSSLDVFEHNFSESGNYTLNLTVTDPAGNSRNDSIRILVKAPRIVQERDTDGEEDDEVIPNAYIIFGAAIIIAIILILIASVVSRKRRVYDDVEADWEEDEDWGEDDDDWDEDDDDDWDDEEAEEIEWEDE